MRSESVTQSAYNHIEALLVQTILLSINIIIMETRPFGLGLEQAMMKGIMEQKKKLEGFKTKKYY